MPTEAHPLIPFLYKWQLPPEYIHAILTRLVNQDNPTSFSISMSCHCRFVQFSLTVPQSFSSTAQQYTQLRPGLLAENNLGKALPLFPGSSYHQSQRKSFVMSSTNFSHNKFFAYQNPYGLLLQLECCCFLGRQYDRHWQPSALNKAAACAKEALNEGYSNSMSIQALASNQNHLHTFLHHQSEH